MPIPTGKALKMTRLSATPEGMTESTQVFEWNVETVALNQYFRYLAFRHINTNITNIIPCAFGCRMVRREMKGDRCVSLNCWRCYPENRLNSEKTHRWRWMYPIHSDMQSFTFRGSKWR